MCLDKIHTLRTGVSLEISTTVLHELIAKAINRHELSELAAIHSPADLHEYLSVIVYSGAEELVQRRQRWINQKLKQDLIAQRPIQFNRFSNLFWRNLDEDDPDGDEWQQLIASDEFQIQLTMLLNKLRITERNLLQYQESDLRLNFEVMQGGCR